MKAPLARVLRGRLEALTAQDIRQVLNTNLLAPMLPMQALLPAPAPNDRHRQSDGPYRSPRPDLRFQDPTLMTCPAPAPRSHSTRAPSRRRLVGALAAMALAACGGLLPLAARAGGVDDAVIDLQHEWEVVKYQTAASERERRYEALAVKAHKVSETYAGRAEPLIWEGIIVSSWASEKGGLGALSLVRKSKAMYESAIAIESGALEGSAYNSLGALYYKVPGWPLGFGDKDKARQMIQKALTINPKGIDPNYFYGEYLVETKHPAEAIPYLERAQQAPMRPGRQIADVGRREEIRELLEKIKPH